MYYLILKNEWDILILIDPPRICVCVCVCDYCLTPYQRLWLYNGAPLVAFYDTLGIRRTSSRLKPPASSRGATDLISWYIFKGLKIVSNYFIFVKICSIIHEEIFSGTALRCTASYLFCKLYDVSVGFNPRPPPPSHKKRIALFLAAEGVQLGDFGWFVFFQLYHRYRFENIFK